MSFIRNAYRYVRPVRGCNCGCMACHGAEPHPLCPWNCKA